MESSSENLVIVIIIIAIPLRSSRRDANLFGYSTGYPSYRPPLRHWSFRCASNQLKILGGDRAFSFYASAVWNSLPGDIATIPDLTLKGK